MVDEIEENLKNDKEETAFTQYMLVLQCRSTTDLVAIPTNSVKYWLPTECWVSLSLYLRFLLCVCLCV